MAAVALTARTWFAKQAVVKLELSSSVTVTTAAALDTFFSAGTAITGIMKDIKIKEPMPDADKIDLLGTDTAGFQNAETEEKPASQVEVSGTLILDGTGLKIETLIYDVGSTVSSTHKRYRAGKASLRKLAILVNFDDGTDECNFAGVNMLATARDDSLNADGHVETTITLKGLARDWYGPEFKV